MRKEEYLDRLTEQIRCRKARGPVRKEICQHIEEQTEEYMTQGMTQAEASEAAVQDMGDPVEAGTELDRIHRPQMAWKLILLIGVIGALCLALQLAVHSHSPEYVKGTEARQIFYYLAGYAAMVAVCYLDYSRIGHYAKWLSATLAAAAAILLPRFGLAVNGAVHWIAIGGFVIDAVKFILLLIPMYGAILYSYKGQGYAALLKCILWMLPGCLAALISASTSILFIMGISYVILLTVGICKNWICVSKKPVLAVMWTIVLASPVLICVYVLNFGHGYQIQRLQTALRSNEGTWVTEQSLVGYVASCYGILTAAVLIGLILFLFLRFLRISLKQKNELGMIMGIGCCTVLLQQLGWYLLNNMGRNVLEVYCPFFTYGGSSMLASFMMFGIILSIHRYEHVLGEG